jgi:hypothetical protein
MLYRHGIETALKHLGRVLAFVCDEPKQIKLTHKLWDNWRIVRSCMEKVGEGVDELDQIESKLNDLLELDPNGEVFRYPETREGSPYLQDTSLINVEVFAVEISLIATFFDGACAWADHLVDLKQEALEIEKEMGEEFENYFADESRW